MRVDPAQPTAAAFRQQIDRQLDDFLAAKRGQLEAVSPTLGLLTDVAADLAAGGKRLRPAFAYWGHVAAAGNDQVPEALWPAISAIELLHVGVLVHDDVLDESDTRRGRPAAHRQFEAWHRSQAPQGPSAEFGRKLAVLLGDQLLVWSDELARADRLGERAAGFWYAVRTEVNSGQVLDICAQYRVGAPAGVSDEQVASQVLEEKTSRYTVQRPLQFGAAAGGASDQTLAALGQYGQALGRAFQLRDDLLGIFAEQAQTGKPAAGDLREGKRTVLLARSLDGLAASDRAQLGDLLGREELDDDQIGLARALMTASGAVEQIEQAILDDHAAALAALDDARISPAGHQALVELARQCVERSY
ncbi:MAG: polyprenyl synthetase family protein [Brooklawnia sp.]|jgi:geranylgeranyl diphosphate synthase type I